MLWRAAEPLHSRQGGGARHRVRRGAFLAAGRDVRYSAGHSTPWRPRRAAAQRSNTQPGQRVEVPMELNRIDEIAATLDDMTTTLEEIKEDPCLVSAQTLESMRRSIEKAADSIDRIENKQPDTNRR